MCSELLRNICESLSLRSVRTLNSYSMESLIPLIIAAEKSHCCHLNQGWAFGRPEPDRASRMPKPDLNAKKPTTAGLNRKCGECYTDLTSKITGFNWNTVRSPNFVISETDIVQNKGNPNKIRACTLTI